MAHSPNPLYSPQLALYGQVWFGIYNMSNGIFLQEGIMSHFLENHVGNQIDSPHCKRQRAAKNSLLKSTEKITQIAK
jgi:hypothetical protein